MTTRASHMRAAASPYVTAHAADRWDTRTPVSSVAPETAWRHAQRVAGASLTTGVDECRFHAPTRTLLLRAGHSIVTVLSPTEWDEDVQRAIEPLLTRVTDR